MKQRQTETKNENLRDGDAARNSSESGAKESLYSFLSLVLLIPLVFAFKSSVLDANNIPSASMLPTLKIGDYLFVNKMRYSFLFPFLERPIVEYDDPRRGDIVTFEPPTETNRNFVKRLIGEPGDQFRIRQISACDLHKKIRSRSPFPDGKLPPPLPPEKRDYRCPGEKGVSRFQPPYLTIYEYRPNGQGPWLNYGPEEVPAKEARKILIDSDDVHDSLHPDLIPASFLYSSDLPVLYKETINGNTHYILESSLQASVGEALLNQDCTIEKIHTTGCTIPKNRYFVMGDNRDDSHDSRYLGFIHRDLFRGKVVIAYFSINWYQKICEEYAKARAQNSLWDTKGVVGFDLPDFPPEEQARYCHLVGEDGRTGPLAVLKNFLFYQIPRMDIRWYRIGRLLH